MRGSVRSQGADVVDAFAQHQGTIQTHAEGEPGPTVRVEPGGREQSGSGEAALGELQPVAVDVDVELSSGHGVGMHRWHRSPVGTGQDGLHEDGEHLGEVVWTQSGGRGESPQVDLVRLADMGTVDAVAPVDQARHDVELVADRIGGHLA